MRMGTVVGLFAVVAIGVGLARAAGAGSERSLFYQQGFFQASGARATMDFGNDPSTAFVFATEASKGVDMLTIAYRDKAGAGQAIFLLMPESKEALDPRKLLEKVVAMSGMAASGKPGGTKLGNAQVVMVNLVGKDADGKALGGAAGAVVDGNQALLFMLRGNERGLDPIKKMVLTGLQSLRLGKSVPASPRQDPGTSLAGVWLGPYRGQGNEWFVFDAEGRCHEGAPRGKLGTELAARWLKFPDYTCLYKVDGNKLRVTWKDGRQWKLDFKALGDGKIEVRGDQYRRVSGKNEGARLAGTYEAWSGGTTGGGGNTTTYSSSSTYIFKKDGRFSLDGSFAAVGTTTDGSGEWSGSMGASVDNPAKSGTYAIASDTITFTFADGRRRVATFYRHPAEDILFIDGAGYYVQE